MQDETRRVHGARGIGALIPAVARPAFRKRNPASAQLLADWPAIVGPELAATTAPRRLAQDRLTIACAGPAAMELQHLAPLLVERINAHLGQALVRELRFVQDLTLITAPESRPPKPAPDTAERLERKLAKVAEGPLKDALASLGRSVLSSRPSLPPKLSTSGSRKG